MSPIDICGHATYLLLAASYLVRDLVWLRLISIPASICSIAFHYFAPAEPLWLIINWNLLFLSVHLGQLALTYYERRAVNLSGDIAEFAKMVSPRLSAAQSVRLFHQADRNHLQGPCTLLREHDEAEDLIFVLSGTVQATQNGKVIGECGRGTFLGEISFLTGELHSASIHLSPDHEAIVLRWNQDVLRAFAETRPEFYVALQQCLAANLSRKFTMIEQNLERSSELQCV